MDELPRLQEAIERVGANLLGLEQDPTAALLDAADLHGETAARWSACREASAGLFQSYAALRAVAEQAAAVRGARREALLTQPSITLGYVARPMGDRALLDGSRVVERCTPDELLAWMAVWFDGITGLIADVARTWDVQVPRVRSARERLASLPVGADLAGLDVELDEVARTLLSDPLAVDPARLDRIDDLLTGAATEHEDWAERIASARVLLTDVRRSVDEAAVVTRHVAAKISTAHAQSMEEADPELGGELERLARLSDVAGLADWHRRATDLLARSRAVTATSRALLDERDELRGRLDAYRAKADRLGRLEDPELAALGERGPRRAVHGADRPPPRRPPGPPVPGGADAVNCSQPGCTGTVEDGYCNDCGLAPSREAPSDTEIRGVPAAARASTTPTGRSRVSAGTGAVRRSRLGAGLVDIPPVPARDPATVVMSDPTVAEHRRFCRRCDEPVGRTPGRSPRRAPRGSAEPVAHRSRSRPSSPAARPIAGQYEVIGCLAHGGLGWIYLARDHHVSDRWVVLKGLLDGSDEHAMAAALAERRFLAEVEHPNIVKIHNFVEHGGDGYIVMEYVNGISLRGMLEARRADNAGPRPAAGRAGHRLLPRDPPRARPPARARADLLRLQAGQRDPDVGLG